MTQSDAERFAAAMKETPSLVASVKTAGGGIAGIVAVAKQQGYNVSPDDAKSYLAARSKGRLSDDQLGQIAGGKGGSTTTTAAVQSTVAVTSVAGVAEVDVAAAAVAVIVLT